MKSNRINSIFLVFVFLSVFYCSAISNDVTAEPLADLIIKTNGGGIRPDYITYVANYLNNLNINVTVVIEEWVVFVGSLLITYDFDMFEFNLLLKNLYIKNN